MEGEVTKDAERINQIRARLFKLKKDCFCGLPGCNSCEADEDFESNSVPDISFMLSCVAKLEARIEKLREGLDEILEMYRGSSCAHGFGDPCQSCIAHQALANDDKEKG